MAPLPAYLWPALAGLLLLLVLLGLDSDGLLLVGGVAALLLTAATAVVPLPAALQILLFAALGGAGYLGLRRWSLSTRNPELPPSPRAETAEVIDGFDAGGEGRVRWQGQSWAATNLEPARPLPPGSRVTVLGREGTHLQVLPRVER